MSGRPVADVAEELRVLLGIDPERRLPPVFLWRKAIAASSLPPTTSHILRALSEHMDADGGSCFPSVETQAAETRHHARTIRRSLREAEGAGWVATGLSRGRRANTYVATVPVAFRPGRHARDDGGQGAGDE